MRGGDERLRIKTASEEIIHAMLRSEGGEGHCLTLWLHGVEMTPSSSVVRQIGQSSSHASHSFKSSSPGTWLGVERWANPSVWSALASPIAEKSARAAERNRCARLRVVAPAGGGATASGVLSASASVFMYLALRRRRPDGSLGQVFLDDEIMDEIEVRKACSTDGV